MTKGIFYFCFILLFEFFYVIFPLFFLISIQVNWAMRSWATWNFNYLSIFLHFKIL